MIRTLPSKVVTLFTLVSALAVAALTSGCGATVVSGDDPQGTGGGASDQTCTAYAGDACTPGATMACDTCGEGQNGEITYSTSTITCEPVKGESCTTKWSTDPSECICDTPLVLSFDGAPVAYSTDRARSFDLNGTRSQLTDWPTAATPWLALDRDGSGTIDDGSELFGSMTVLSSGPSRGQRARNGFEALRELDANGDGKITAADPGFSKLIVWADRDGDRVSSASEIATASAWQLLSIDLGFRSEPRCDARGNCEVERASFTWRDAQGAVRTGEVVDVHLPARR